MVLLYLAFISNIVAEIIFTTTSPEDESKWPLIVHYSIMGIAFISLVLEFIAIQSLNSHPKVQLFIARNLQHITRGAAIIYTITAFFLSPRNLIFFIPLEILMTYSLQMNITGMSTYPMHVKILGSITISVIANVINSLYYGSPDGTSVYLLIIYLLAAYFMVRKVY